MVNAIVSHSLMTAYKVIMSNLYYTMNCKDNLRTRDYTLCILNYFVDYLAIQLNEWVEVIQF